MSIHVWLALGFAITIQLAVIVALLVSIKRPKHRIWPPGDLSWRFWFYWISSTLILVALTYVGKETADNFFFHEQVWNLAGAVLLVMGLAFAGWAGYTFRMAESFGLQGELHTEGPYAYSRNPQYVGCYGILLGIVLIVNSFHLLIGLLPTLVWIALLPLAEEPWLREQFGKEYEQYCQRVPRLMSLQTIKMLAFPERFD